MHHCRFRINYLFVLDMDPQHSATVTQTLMTAANLTILLLASFIIHFKVHDSGLCNSSQRMRLLFLSIESS